MRVPLRSKYSLILICLISGVIILLSVTSLNTFKRSMGNMRVTITNDISDTLMEQVEFHTNSLVSLLQSQLKSPLYYYDLDRMNNVLNNVLNQKNIMSAVVFDTQCHIIHDGNEDLTNFKELYSLSDHCTNRPESVFFKSVEENSLTVSQPIYLGDKPLGGIAVTFSTEEIKKIFKETETLFKQRETEDVENLQLKLIFLTILIVLAALLFAVFISSRLVKPIEKLGLHARKIGRGHYKDPIQSDRNDELGDLMKSFEQMRINLKNTTVSVEQLQTEIEEKNETEKQRKLVEQQLHRAQRMEAMGQLASGVAHDLNNILSGIVTLPQLLLMDIPEDSPARKPLSQIQESGKRAAGIVQDMLTLARSGIQVGEPIDLKATIEQYLESQEHKELARLHPHITFTKDLTEEKMLVKGAQVQLFSVLMNLITNAAEAIKNKGEITILLTSVYVDKPFGTYDSVKEGDYLRLDIKDNGQGISREDMSHIFEPFYTRKEMGRSGTGLGMAIVWNAIQDHMGYIDLTSEVNKGTTVSLYFPITREFIDQELPESITSTQNLNGNGEHILIVDDIKSQRDIASSILNKLNYTTATLEAGEKVLDYLENNKADLIIMDMIMEPGIDGLETCNRVFSKYPEAIILITSGYSESEKVRTAIKLGAKQYIKKPYSIETIGMAMKSLLNEET